MKTQLNYYVKTKKITLITVIGIIVALSFNKELFLKDLADQKLKLTT